FGSDDERAAQEDGHPYAGQAWYREFLSAREGAREKFDPWRTYWAHPLATRYLNVDSAGYRVTVQPRPRASAARSVYLLGGSAMWGFTSRDSLTIPSLVAAGLDSAGFTDVAVVNLAQSGYVLGHEIATLTQELAQAARPAVAVFFDGINDIRTTQLYQQPGRAFFEQRFSHLYEKESQRGFFGSFVTPGERSKLLARLIQALGIADPWAVAPQKPDICPRLGTYYRNMHQTAMGLGSAWGFEVLFVQQPMHATTRKALTPFEKSFMGPEWHVKYTRDCAEAIDSALADKRGTTYTSYASMFDDVSESVFLDRFGHVTEAGNRRIANALVREIVARLASKPNVRSDSILNEHSELQSRRLESARRRRT
ncbi:MAG: SGNH/GDSL hydrolase family protein, partial [Gemmatimonadaceae bacterium]